MAHEFPTLYVCDPMKNPECSKTSCIHNPAACVWCCYATPDADKAVLDKDGKPMIAPNSIIGEYLHFPIFRVR